MDNLPFKSGDIIRFPKKGQPEDELRAKILSITPIQEETGIEYNISVDWMDKTVPNVIPIYSWDVIKDCEKINRPTRE